jgi:hypothetical protein
LRLLIIDGDSEEALAEMQAHGLPYTARTRTWHGEHHWYAAPGDVPRTRVARRGESRHIDVLTAGYGVLPPSRHRFLCTYTWIVSPDAAPFAPAPRWALDMLAKAPTGTTPAPTVALGDLERVLLSELGLDARTRALIREGQSPRYPSRSEALWAVLHALIAAGYGDRTIASVLLDPRYAISAKPREQGRRWLAREIARARAKSDVELFA